MTTWETFAAEAPELAAAVRERLDGHPYKLLATLRRDGTPRISGIEVELREDGELVAGSMPDSAKTRDLDRDPRCCLHTAPAPADGWTGDAKLTAVAVPTTGAQPGARYYRLDLREAATVEVGDGALRLAVWRPGEPVRRWSR